MSHNAFAKTLMEIYNLALENDPSFKSAISTRNSATESVNISRGNFLPNIGVNASYSDNNGTTIFFNPDTNTTSTFNSEAITRYSVTLTQPIYRRGNYATHARNKHFAKQAETDFSAAKQNLIIRVAEQYFDVLSARDTLEFNRAEKNAISRQLEQTKQRFDVGLVAITDVHEAQARYDLSVAQRIEAENDVNNRLEALRALTGEYHELLSPLVDQTPLPPPEPDSIEAWTKTALEQNPSLTAAQYLVEQLRDSVDAARANYHPTLDFSTTYSDSDATNATDSTSYRLDFSLNLFAGGTTKALVRQALHDLNQAQESLEKQRRTTQQDVRSAYLRAQADISLVKALKQAVVSSESRLKASEAGFEVGTRTTVDVLNARQDLFRAQKDYSLTRYRYILDMLRLKQAAGLLSVQDLEKINGWLEL
ncbi:MAG: TolC family outer membrane protein [Gammaproteobacteria bacterium]|nr:TolC family outer membrane protein [Gammaproteobacteria bacterium]